MQLVNSTIDNTSGLNVPTVISASESAGTFREHRMQGHRMNLAPNGATYAIAGGGGGTFSSLLGSALDSYLGSTTGDPKTDGTHGTPNIGYTNEMNNISTTAYMRIK